MKLLCTMKMHDWGTVEHIKQKGNKFIVAQYKICKNCDKKQPIGAYQYWENIKLGEIINYLNLN